MHHRKTRGSGGEDSIANCYTVCDRCHNLIDEQEEWLDWEGIDGRRQKYIHKSGR